MLGGRNWVQVSMLLTSSSSSSFKKNSLRHKCLKHLSKLSLTASILIGQISCRSWSWLFLNVIQYAVAGTFTHTNNLTGYFRDIQGDHRGFHPSDPTAPCHLPGYIPGKVNIFSVGTSVANCRPKAVSVSCLRAVSQLFDVDRTTSAPTKCSQHLDFNMDLTVQFVWAKSPLWLMFPLIKGLLYDLMLNCVLHGAHNPGCFGCCSTSPPMNLGL